MEELELGGRGVGAIDRFSGIDVVILSYPILIRLCLRSRLCSLESPGL